MVMVVLAPTGAPQHTCPTQLQSGGPDVGGAPELEAPLDEAGHMMGPCELLRALLLLPPPPDDEDVPLAACEEAWPLEPPPLELELDVEALLAEVHPTASAAMHAAEILVVSMSPHRRRPAPGMATPSSRPGCGI